MNWLQRVNDDLLDLWAACAKNLFCAATCGLHRVECWCCALCHRYQTVAISMCITCQEPYQTSHKRIPHLPAVCVQPAQQSDRLHQRLTHFQRFHLLPRRCSATRVTRRMRRCGRRALTTWPRGVCTAQGPCRCCLASTPAPPCSSCTSSWCACDLILYVHDKSCL